ncbi:XRCC4 domain containing protein [Trichuris trichiura]|uniref:XRCC4 domain containing protein n=1 Tax=Trichuris trichiura TaxID=36087 RepID=A0A077ZAZ6_TRITR|nr:XRCC4 domain containing protein [Trichuris trichiura]
MGAFCAVKTVDGKAYFIFSDVKAEDSCINSISIILSDGIRHFTTKLDQSCIKEMAEQSNLDYRSYCEQLLAAIGGVKSNDVTEYFYDIVCDDVTCSVKFTWKRALTQTTSYHLGTIQLKSLTGSKHVKAAADMLSFCSDEIASLKKKLDSTEQAYEQMVEDRDGAINNFREAVEAKIKSEEQLMEKFANLLNEKKKRIEQLEKAGNVTLFTYKLISWFKA